MGNYLNSVNVGELVRELYDFSKLGVIPVYDFVTPEGIAALKTASHAARDAGLHDDLIQEVDSKVKEEMKTFYLERFGPDPSQIRIHASPYTTPESKQCLLKIAGMTDAKHEQIGPNSMPEPILKKFIATMPPFIRGSAEHLIREYDSFYAEFAKIAGFHASYNSIAFHHYWKGSIGVTPHRDSSGDANLISTLVVDGSCPFGVSKDREKNGAFEFEAPAGTLILMRGPRTDEEKKFRPFHYLVGPINEERHSILIRYRKDYDKAHQGGYL